MESTGAQWAMLIGMAIVVVVVVRSCDKPDLPVEVTFRESVIGYGYVARFHNLSDKHLAIRVQLENDTVNQDMDGFLELSPGDTDEIGWAQGWKFVSGEEIRVSLDGYDSINLRVP